MSDQYFKSGRRSGKTQWMLEQCVQAIEEGQPYVRVIGHTFQYANNSLRNRLIDMLSLEVTHKGYNYIEVEGTAVLFSGPLKEETLISDYRFGNFYDHYMGQEYE